MDEYRVLWDYAILGALSDGKVQHLSEIYYAIDQTAMDGTPIINPQLFNIEPRWGAHPKFYHTVRSTMSSLRRRGMVERVGTGRTGRYRITDTGRKRLKEVEP